MIMIQFTASYINGDTNFVIQNIKMMEDVIKKDPAICILKNILQRGNPTKMSRFLQENLHCESCVHSTPSIFRNR